MEKNKSIIEKQKQFTYTDKDTTAQAANLPLLSSLEDIQEMRIAGAQCFLAYTHTQGTSTENTKWAAFSK